MGQIFDDVMNIFNGQTPIKRQNPRPGESAYYCVNPGQNLNTSTFTSLQTTDMQDNQPLFNTGQGLNQNQPSNSTWDTLKNAANNFAGGTEAFSVGYATGASLGNFDEGMGLATAALTGNSDNYTMGRDAVRQLQNNLQQQHPWAYGAGEFIGAMQTPMHLAKDTTSGYRAFNAATDTLNASAGYAENWNDFGVNMAVNGAANVIGLKAEQLPLWRASARPLMQFGKKVFKQGINSSADKAKNMYYNGNGNEEKYY